MATIGVCLSLGAACCHSGIDALRKSYSKQFEPGVLVAAVQVIEAVLSWTFVLANGNLNNMTLARPAVFALATIGSSAVLLCAKYLYQKALQLSPLSLTVPYLSFTPALLFFTAYIFVNEVPTPSGVCGVALITVAGYLLSLQSAQSAGRNRSGDLPVVEVSPDVVHEVSRIQSADGAQAALNSENLYNPKQKLVARAKAVVGHFRKEPGILLMVGVAALFSITSSVDKLGVLNAPSVSIYLAFQRLIMGLASMAYLLARAKLDYAAIFKGGLPLLLTAVLELAAVILYLNAVTYTLVTYAVALKRFNVLFSVVIGGLVFKENILSRLPYVCLMLFGMILVVAEPLISTHPGIFWRHLL